MSDEGKQKFNDTLQKLRKEKEDKVVEEQQKEQGALMTLESLRSMAGVGMSHVDKSDIRPPQILLVQKLSDLDQMVDLNGNRPTYGQFFDTGARQIISDGFDCYVVFAKKGYYSDRRNPEKGQLEQYIMIGVMKETQRIFGMSLRSSARFGLNALFSTAIDQGYPMFAFNIHVETKELQNDNGKWMLPVFRVGELEKDPVMLGFLAGTARKFDSQADVIDVDQEEDAQKRLQEVTQATGAEKDESTDIPF